MNVPFYVLRHSLALIAVVGLLGARAESDPVPVAFVEKIIGDVTLQSKTGQVKLDPKTDVGRILYSDESLSCVGNAKAIIHISGPGTDVCRPKEPWHPPQPRESASIKMAKDLENYGKRAGRDKGSESAIYSPPDQGAILPQKLVVRWRTRPPLGSFTAVLLDGHGTELARAAAVDGGTGVLESSAFRAALTKYRETVDPTHEAKLIFRFDTEPEQSVTFTVLTQQQESELDKALAQKGSDHGLFGYIERAAIFDSFRMYDSVAAEYDAALTEAPESRELLRAALNAHARTGNLRRARELRERLATIEDQAKN
jgi:hypothetical protein